MTTEGKRPLDPEIQVLLEEAAQDPRSHLLCVPHVDVPLEFDRPVGPGAAFLNAAEKRILEVHRAEVAQLLLEAAQHAIAAHPSAAATLNRSLTVDREFQLSDPERWRVRTRNQLQVAPDELRREDAYGVLAACVSSGQSTASPVELAAASLRLVPRIETRIWLAIALHQAEQFASARNLVSTTVAMQASHLTTSCAWETIGGCEWDLRRPEASLLAYRTAASTLELRSTPIMNWLIVALSLENRASALEAAKRLGELVSEDHPSIEEFIRLNRGRARNGSWVPSDAAKRMVKTIDDQLPAAARKVTHAAF